jgi:hypothetical protein
MAPAAFARDAVCQCPKKLFAFNMGAEDGLPLQAVDFTWGAHFQRAHQLSRFNQNVQIVFAALRSRGAARREDRKLAPFPARMNKSRVAHCCRILMQWSRQFHQPVPSAP